MRRRLIIFLLIITCSVYFCSCSMVNSDSTFCITFIDVGQGDAALVECDGQYMLIDGGDTSAGNKVYNVLESKGIQKLDILAVSHMHSDHIGGLIKALSYASSIKNVICNTSYSDAPKFADFEHQLSINAAKITVPHVGDKYKLGSAEVEVVDVSAVQDNDSLVLMITYGDTRFLFTGDIEDEAQTRISDKYENESDEAYKIDLIKMPHHGSCSPKSVNGTGSLYRFVRTFMPTYAVISVGTGNTYGHPHQETLDLLDDADVKVYRTDLNGDITVKSDGKTVSIVTER